MPSDTRTVLWRVVLRCVPCGGRGTRTGYALGYEGLIASEVCGECRGVGFRVY